VDFGCAALAGVYDRQLQGSPIRAIEKHGLNFGTVPVVDVHFSSVDFGSAAEPVIQICLQCGRQDRVVGFIPGATCLLRSASICRIWTFSASLWQLECLGALS
jgi:hypothetical protein